MYFNGNPIYTFAPRVPRPRGRVEHENAFKSIYFHSTTHSAQGIDLRKPDLTTLLQAYDKVNILLESPVLLEVCEDCYKVFSYRTLKIGQ